MMIVKIRVWLGLVNMLMWFVINPFKDLNVRLQMVTSHRALPDGPADKANPVNIRAIRVKKVSPPCFSSVSWRAFIGFRVDSGGRRVMKTRDDGYMHVTPQPFAGGKLPRMRVATGEL
jgi:hypothetical protein